MARRTSFLQMGLRQADPYALLGAVISFVLVLINDPWWSINGTADSSLLSIQVSPYYLRTFATGLAQTVPFAGPLGFATRMVLVMGFLALLFASFRPTAWWHDLASYFGMSALAELFFSFLLMFHAAETTLIAAYGTLPPFLGTGQLSASIIGLDLAIHAQPLVTAGFSFPLYLGIVCSGLLGLSLVGRRKRETREKMGVGAIFTSGEDEQD